MDDIRIGRVLDDTGIHSLFHERGFAVVTGKRLSCSSQVLSSIVGKDHDTTGAEVVPK